MPRSSSGFLYRVERSAGVLLAALLSGCGGSPPPEQVAQTAAVDSLLLGPVPKTWAAEALAPAGGRPAWIAAPSHGEGFLALWAVDSTRQPTLIGRYPDVGFHPDGVRWVDFDGDGRSDLLVAAEGRGEIQLWRPTDDGGGLALAGAVETGEPPTDMVAADLDADGNTDLVSAPYDAPRLTLLWGRGGFAFDRAFVSGPATTNPPRALPSHPVIADWDRDGRRDILWGDRRTGAVLVAINRGARQFEVRELAPPAVRAVRQVAFADLDGDGIGDLVAALEVAGHGLILYNDGTGGVRATDDVPAPGPGYTNVDVLGGADPLLVFSESRRVILARRSDAGWQLRQLPAGEAPRRPQLIDVDGDGALDLLVASARGEAVSLLFGPLWERATELP